MMYITIVWYANKVFPVESANGDLYRTTLDTGFGRFRGGGRGVSPLAVGFRHILMAAQEFFRRVAGRMPVPRRATAPDHAGMNGTLACAGVTGC